MKKNSKEDESFHWFMREPSYISLMSDIHKSDELIGETIKRVSGHYKSCEVCGKESHHACKNCKSVFYCGNECHQKDWKEGHYIECKAIKDGLKWGDLMVDGDSEDLAIRDIIIERHLGRHELDPENEESGISFKELKNGESDQINRRHHYYYRSWPYYGRRNRRRWRRTRTRPYSHYPRGRYYYNGYYNRRPYYTPGYYGGFAPVPFTPWGAISSTALAALGLATGVAGINPYYYYYYPEYRRRVRRRFPYYNLPKNFKPPRRPSGGYGAGWTPPTGYY